MTVVLLHPDAQREHGIRAENADARERSQAERLAKIECVFVAQGREQTHQLIVLGKLVQEYIADQTAAAREAGRRRAYIAAVSEIRERLERHSDRKVNVSRLSGSYWLAKLFGVETVERLTPSLVRTMLPLVKRDATDPEQKYLPVVETERAGRKLIGECAAGRHTVATAAARMASILGTELPRPASKGRRGRKRRGDAERLSKQFCRLASRFSPAVTVKGIIAVAKLLAGAQQATCLAELRQELDRIIVGEAVPAELRADQPAKAA